MTADDLQRWRRAPRWAFRVLDGKVVAASPERGDREFSGSAAAVWIALDVPGTVDEVTDRIVDAIGPAPADGPATDREIVAEALVVLEQHGLVEPAD